MRLAPAGADLHNVEASTPAIVLKLDPNPMHHGGLGVIRSLGRLGVSVYAVQEDQWAPAAHSRFLAGRYFWRPDPEDTDRLTAGLLRLADRIGRPSVVIATDDAGSLFLAECGNELRSSFIFPRPPRDLPRRLAGKYSLYELCNSLGVPSPRAVMVTTQAEATDFSSLVGFPLIAKLATPWRTQRGGLRSTTVVTDAGHLDEVSRACRRAGVALMLQEFIPGGMGHDWFFHGYCNARSECRPAFTGVKQRSYPAHAGLTSLGRSVANDRLRHQATALLAALGYCGIVDLDIRWDARDDQYKLLDFNPRLGAQFRLFRDTAGIDVVLAQYLDLTGQPVPEREQVSGRCFVTENYDPLAAFGYWRGGELGLKSWMASLLEVDETAWFARDDLRPFGLMCARMGWRMISRPFAGNRRQPVYSDARYRAGRAAARLGGAASIAHPGSRDTSGQVAADTDERTGAPA
jgi:D-aspartate ligase